MISRLFLFVSIFLFSLIILSCKGSSDGQDVELERITVSPEIKEFLIGNTKKYILDCLNQEEVLGHKLYAIQVLRDFYKNCNYQAAWINTNNIDQALSSIYDIYFDGLQPEDYHYCLLKEKLASFKSEEIKDSLAFAQFDVLLSDAIITASMHLSTGKVNPESLKRQWFVTPTNYQERFNDAASLLQQRLDEHSISVNFEKLKPDHYMYTGLKEALLQYRELKKQGDWDSISAGETLKPYDKSIRVLQLRARLLASGDLPEYISPNDSIFDSILFVHTQLIQKKYGIEADGNVGKQTVEELNIPLDYRIEQIKANLERARWVLYNLEDKFIVVNIAAYELYFVMDDKELLTSRVIVGKQHTKTTIFKDYMQYVVINPTWGVPRSLYAGYIEKLKTNPDYFASKNMVVITTSGKPVSIQNTDWSGYSLSNFPYMFRQNSGPNNALGYIKCMFPNKYSIYIHDTPARSLFQREERAFSHGCIRTQKIRDVAEMLLKPNDQAWSQEKIAAVIESGKTTTISLKERVPVLIIYWTAGIGFQKNFYFKPDVYNRDKDLISALNADFKA
ncbi:MAG: hypothetical protein B7C24_04715 [Bacteroidetes bacterium 4572_77]|nr:MAG: hypothetical protein B7C24_04715 [Bacteroidetes bacterium 4572_77]